MAPSGDKRILVTHQPIGLSLLITPWNFPAGMATRKIGPAVAAGCTMILKPASETPLTALAIVDIMERAGLPAGVLNLIIPKEVGPAISKILHDPRLKNLSFTGSTVVGKHLLHEAADNVIRCCWAAKTGFICPRLLNPLIDPIKLVSALDVKSKIGVIISTVDLSIGMNFTRLFA
jgi:acyl-CoA reductase-like NAD-dependent aldehyde dehydrogenase